MKMKEFGPPGGGGRASLAPPLRSTNGYYYGPQSKFAKAMFSQVSVCPQGSVCLWSRGVCVADTPLSADTPLGRHTPKAGTPLGRYSPGRHPCGRHTLKQTVNKRVVRIPRECILVSSIYIEIRTGIGVGIEVGQCKHTISRVVLSKSKYFYSQSFAYASE